MWQQMHSHKSLSLADYKGKAFFEGNEHALRAAVECLDLGICHLVHKIEYGSIGDFSMESKTNLTGLAG